MSITRSDLFARLGVSLPHLPPGAALTASTGNGVAVNLDSWVVQFGAGNVLSASCEVNADSGVNIYWMVISVDVIDPPASIVFGLGSDTKSGVTTSNKWFAFANTGMCPWARGTSVFSSVYVGSSVGFFTIQKTFDL